ncbi:MAG: hypothetical protein OXK17_07450 [Thaumarchaeota archaeon]|nr:hypothetical protein [Nitrososphaerota archaeon]
MSTVTGHHLAVPGLDVYGPMGRGGGCEYLNDCRKRIGTLTVFLSNFLQQYTEQPMG